MGMNCLGWVIKKYLNSGCLGYSYFPRERHELLEKMKRANKAVTEIVGTMLLLGISVSLFSVIYIAVLTVSPSPPIPSVNLICTAEENNVILEHRGGKTLDLDTEFSVTIAGTNEKFKVGDYLNNESKDNGVWDIGERVVYPAGDVMDLEVSVTVVDVQSNSVILMGVIRER